MVGCKQITITKSLISGDWLETLTTGGECTEDVRDFEVFVYDGNELTTKTMI